MEKKIVLFGTRDLYKDAPIFVSQEPTTFRECKHNAEPVFTTGKLEKAIELGMDTYLISVRFAFFSYERWWLDRLEEGHFFHNGLSLMGIKNEVKPTELVQRFMSSWREFYDKMRIPWVDEFDDLFEPREHLIKHHGFIDGDSIPGIGVDHGQGQ